MRIASQHSFGRFCVFWRSFDNGDVLEPRGRNAFAQLPKRRGINLRGEYTTVRPQSLRQRFEHSTLAGPDVGNPTIGMSLATSLSRFASPVKRWRKHRNDKNQRDEKHSEHPPKNTAP
jgi:hypothetical protein